MRTGTDEPAPNRPPRNRLAVWSLVFSAATLFGLGSIVGIALGVIALNQMAVRRSAGVAERGRAFALGGIALGALTSYISMIVFVRYFVENG